MSSNENIIRNQITLKNLSSPYHATKCKANSVVTDVDHHPYTRFFKGQRDSHTPVVHEREAGWRPLRNECYNPIVDTHPDPYPDHCWETACSVGFPCRSCNVSRKAHDVQMRSQCIVQIP